MKKFVTTDKHRCSYRITPYDPEIEKQMRLAEEGMARYRNTLRALAELKKTLSGRKNKTSC